MGNFGDQFKIARERKGYSLNELSERTKIRKENLQALEEENFSILPAPVYACGFVKQYAEILELNAAEMVEQFKYLAYHAEVASNGGRKTRNKKKRVKKYSVDFKRLLVVIAFLILAVFIGYTFVQYFINNAAL